MKIIKIVNGAILGALVLGAGCGSEDPRPATIHNVAMVPEVRPDTPGNVLQFHFDPGDIVETAASPSGKILVHFTRNGKNAVPAQDGDMSGVPDFVEEVTSVYDEVVAYYESIGFRSPRSDEGLPDNGGDGKFDVYLVDFAGIGDGVFQIDSCDAMKKSQCSGYMVQENDYQGYGYPSTLVANRILASHEFFHGIQAAYDREQGTVFSEGTAVWATESFDESLNDFEWFIDGYLNNTGRSLDVPLPGPVDSFSYGAGLFFRFMEEKYGAGTVRALVERTEDGSFGETDPQWLSVTGKMLETQAQATFPESFIEFATWNLFLGSKSDPNRSYVNCAKYPEVKMEVVSAPYSDLLRLFYASAQYYRVFPGGRAKMTAALTSAESALGETSDVVLLLVAERNGKYDAVVRVADVRAGVEEIDVTDADAFVAVAINTTTTGNSRRPTLCIGSPEEVTECKKSVESMGSGGAGGAGGAGNYGGNGGGDPVSPDEPGGCGCRTAQGPSGPGILSLAIFGLAYRRVRRRARRRVKTATDKPA